MFSTIFWAVPAFRRVEAGQDFGRLGGNQDLGSSAPQGRGVHRDCHGRRPTTSRVCSAASTYGVVPLAVIPTTTSCRVSFFARKSRCAFSTESSAPSTAPVTAGRPPAINACTSSGEVPNVGGHSAASSTAIRPSNLLLHISAAPRSEWPW